MTRVVFVGEMYNADLSIGGGPIYPSGPVDPGYSPPWARPRPPYVDNTLPRPPGPVDPGYSPPWATPGPGRPVDPGYSPPWAQAPVDPGYSPPWARPPVDPGWGVTPPVDPGWGVTPPVDPGWGVRPPVDPGYSPPWARPQPPQIAGGPGWLPPFAMPPIYLPPQAPVIDPVDPNKMHLVAYIPNADGTKVERITFTVDKPVSEPPTEATPKV